MGEVSAIEWTDATFNPWWGCTKVSAACKNCYAEAWAKRTGFQIWGQNAERRFFGAAHWSEPRKWNAKAEREDRRMRVFCASMADVFESGGDGELGTRLAVERAKLWILIRETPALDWLLLTKRPENIRLMAPWVDEKDPPANVWLGTTVEDQEQADARIPHLLAVPARVRFLSCEPLLERLNFNACVAWHPDTNGMYLEGIHWVIGGGESGPGARPMDLSWARELRDQCQHARVPFLFKQWGDFNALGERVGKKAAGRDLDGCTWDELPRSAA